MLPLPECLRLEIRRFIAEEEDYADVFLSNLVLPSFHKWNKCSKYGQFNTLLLLFRGRSVTKDFVEPLLKKNLAKSHKELLLMTARGGTGVTGYDFYLLSRREASFDKFVKMLSLRKEVWRTMADNYKDGGDPIVPKRPWFNRAIYNDADLVLGKKSDKERLNVIWRGHLRLSDWEDYHYVGLQACFCADASFTAKEVTHLKTVLRKSYHESEEIDVVVSLNEDFGETMDTLVKKAKFPPLDVILSPAFGKGFRNDVSWADEVFFTDKFLVMSILRPGKESTGDIVIAWDRKSKALKGYVVPASTVEADDCDFSKNEEFYKNFQ